MNKNKSGRGNLDTHRQEKGKIKPTTAYSQLVKYSVAISIIFSGNLNMSEMNYDKMKK